MFLPASAWLSGRLGARRVFCAAVLLSSMAQQVSIALGVVLGAAIVAGSSLLHGRGPGELQPADFPPAFDVVALLALCSAIAFTRLRPEDGAELSGRGSART